MRALLSWATGSRIGVRDDMNEALESCAFAIGTSAIVLCFWIPHVCGMTIGVFVLAIILATGYRISAV